MAHLLMDEVRRAFVFVPQLDQMGNDIKRNTDIDEALREALSNQDCVACNSFGFFKSSVSKLDVSPFYSIVDGIFLKKSWIEKVATGELELDASSLWTRDHAARTMLIESTPGLADQIKQHFMFVPHVDVESLNALRLVGSIEDILLVTLINSSATAVNSCGFVKSALDRVVPWNHVRQVGLYVKRSCLKGPCKPLIPPAPLVRHTFDTFFDRIFVINVASHTARWNHAQEQLARAGIRNVERFDAVTPQTMVKYGWKWPGAHLYQLTHKQVAVQAAMRVNLYCLFQHILSRQFSRVLILEDDFAVHADRLHLASSVFETMETTCQDWDFLYFEGLNARVLHNVTPLVDMVASSLVTTAFAVQSKRLAEFAEMYARAWNHPIDDCLFHVVHPRAMVYMVREKIIGANKEIESTYAIKDEKRALRVRIEWGSLGVLSIVPLEHMFPYASRYNYLDMNPMSKSLGAQAGVFDYKVFVDCGPGDVDDPAKSLVFFTKESAERAFRERAVDVSAFKYVHSLARDPGPIVWLKQTPPCFGARGDKCLVKGVVADAGALALAEPDRIVIESRLPVKLADNANERFKYALVAQDLQNTFGDHLVWESILSEQLCIYIGPPLSACIPEGAVVRIEQATGVMSAIVLDTVRRAMEEDWHGRRIEQIRAAKEAVLARLNWFAVIERIINEG